MLNYFMEPSWACSCLSFRISATFSVYRDVHATVSSYHFHRSRGAQGLRSDAMDGGGAGGGSTLPSVQGSPRTISGSRNGLPFCPYLASSQPLRAHNPLICSQTYRCLCDQMSGLCPRVQNDTRTRFFEPCLPFQNSVIMLRRVAPNFSGFFWPFFSMPG